MGIFLYNICIAVWDPTIKRDSK